MLIKLDQDGKVYGFSRFGVSEMMVESVPLTISASGVPFCLLLATVEEAEQKEGRIMASYWAWDLNGW